MSDKNNPFPLMISVVVTSEEQLRGVYALLAGTAVLAALPGASAPNVSTSAPPSPAPTVAVPTPAAEPLSGGVEVSPPATDDSGEIDAHGHPWSADLHASTKGKTKDGLWRMKVGVTRPDPKPGFPVADATGTPSAGTDAQATASATTEPAPPPASTTDAGGDEDEFAAFRAAAAASDATDAAAAASVPVRQYSDADLGALCNQAAVKLGDPGPVKAIIAEYVPEGQVAHSRNIPVDNRAAFVAAVEEKAGIQFAG